MPTKPISRLIRPLAGPSIPLRSSTTASLRHHGIRPFTLTSTRADLPGVEHNPHPKRDAVKDREKIDPSPDEYAQSGSDDTAAANESAAFNPDITDPQEAKKEAGKGNQVNPLDASPANPELSRGTSEVEGGAGKKKKGKE